MANKNNQTDQPAFSNYAEEATYWDSHDPTTLIEPGTKPLIYKGNPQAKSMYIGESKLVKGLNVRFSDEDLHKLRQVAQAKGLGPTTLIRMWAKEKLQQERVGKLK